MPCNVDINTQEILKFAESADPLGSRTMGVLTKPDLAVEKATQDAVFDLILGKRNTLTLGYCVIKNRGADDSQSTAESRMAAEKAFFRSPPWLSIADRFGIESLQHRLRTLLMDISKREIPHVKSEVEVRLTQYSTELKTLGPPRDSTSAQRMYIGNLASRFQTISNSALNGHYIGDRVFKSTITNFKLITKVVKLNEMFSNEFWKKGHTQHFGLHWDDEGEKTYGCSPEGLSFDLPLKEYPEINDIIVTEQYKCPKPTKGPVMELIAETFEANRGPELGTVGFLSQLI